MDIVPEFFNKIWEWFNNGIYEFVTDAFAQFVIWVTVAGIKLKLWALTFAWDVANEILTELNISTYLQTAWSELDSRILNMVAWFRIPEAVNVILAARVTRFVLDFMGL